MKKFAIINFSKNSFSGDAITSKTEIKSAINLAKNLDFYGIDIGISATNPKVKEISEEYELNFVKENSDLLSFISIFAKELDLKLSIDTIFPSVAKKLCEFGFDYVNDVNFFRNQDFIDVLNKFPMVKYILTHSLSVPVVENQFLSEFKNANKQIIEEIFEKTEKLKKSGIDQNRIVIDPGIGYGKNQEQCWEIIKNFSDFKTLGYETYLAHSRKRFLSNITEKIEDRDIATSVITKILEDVADYARIHLPRIN